MSTSFSSVRSVVGVDAGATLCKLARIGDSFETAVFPSNDLHAARAQIARWDPERVVATGGGAERLSRAMGEIPLHRVAEFDAWVRGAPLLAERAGLELPDRYLLISLGTGTSILWVHPGGGERVGGSALGGGSLLGLGQLLLGTADFDRIAELAERGDRRRVDLLVGDIYQDDETPLPRELNAASFGKIDSREPPDLANALMGLVGENIGLICGEIARARKIDTLVYCGSTLAKNSVLQNNLDLVTRVLGLHAVFPGLGAFCGAVGAASLVPSSD